MIKKTLLYAIMFIFLLSSASVAYAQPMIALTFDDGPSEYTSKLLDGLKERNAKASFFILGERIDENNSAFYSPLNIKLVKRMKAEGHVIGNHSYSHKILRCLSADKAREEIIRTTCLIEKITQETPKYMRPPGGAREITKAVRESLCPLITVCWCYYDVKDWKNTNVERMVSTITDKAGDGDIILLHDTYDTSVETALRVIDALSAKGFKFVNLEELLNRNNGDCYMLDPKRIYYTMKDGDVSKLKKKD